MWRRLKKIELNVVNFGKIKILIKDILYIETYKRNVIVHTKKDDYECRDNIGKLEERLMPEGFYRTHKCYIVNHDEIKSVSSINKKV